MAFLPGDKRIRLVRLCGMLGSDFDGERANAGRLADNLVREAGLTWDQVIASANASYEEPAYKNRRQSPLPAEMAQTCLNARCLWSEWERKFLTDMLGRLRLSEKQQAILADLYSRALQWGPRA